MCFNVQNKWKAEVKKSEGFLITFKCGTSSEGKKREVGESTRKTRVRKTDKKSKSRTRKKRRKKANHEYFYAEKKL